MRTHATNRTAAAVGAITGLILFFAHPMIDAAGRVGSAWLVVCTAAIGLPTYFYVLGAPAEDRTGLWVLRPALLLRVSSFLLAAGAAAALAIACSFAVQYVRTDRCLDSGGSWSHESRECEH